jgi:hypothetical protein
MQCLSGHGYITFRRGGEAVILLKPEERLLFIAQDYLFVPA